MLIAQFSDPHVCLPGTRIMQGAKPAETLARTVAQISAMSPTPDAVLVTGDLVATGSDEEYAILRSELDQLPSPYFVIPGNHDDRDEMRRTFGDLGYLPTRGTFLHYTVEDFDLRLVGLDTIIPGEEGGQLCAERLGWLTTRLSEAPDRPTVIFMHHPPFDIGIAAFDALKCKGGEAMGEIVERYPQIERIVCGHVHRPVQTRWHGTMAVSAPSAAAQYSLALDPDDLSRWTSEPPAYLVHLWRPGQGLLTHTSLVGDFPPDKP